MGACTFYTQASGQTASKAFSSAVDSALWYSGHGGYTGTIAEKDEFVQITVPQGKDPERYAQTLVDEGDGRVDRQVGPGRDASFWRRLPARTEQTAIYSSDVASS